MARKRIEEQDQPEVAQEARDHIVGDFPVDTPGIQDEVRKAVVSGRTVLRLRDGDKHFYRFE